MLTLIADNQRVERAQSSRYSAVELIELLFSHGRPGKMRVLATMKAGYQVSIVMTFDEYLNERKLIQKHFAFKDGLSLAYSKPIDFFEAARLRAAGFASNKQKDIEHRNRQALRNK